MHRQEMQVDLKKLRCLTEGPPPLYPETIQSPPIYINQDPSTPICHHCSRPIEGDLVKALCHSWYPDHFCCHHCGEAIRDRRFHVHQGHPYCPEHYAELFLYSCAFCGQPIKDAVVVALGRPWHRHHFVCHKCSVPLSNRGGYYEKDGFAYCTECFQAAFKPETSSISGDSYKQMRKQVLKTLSQHLADCMSESDVGANGMSGLVKDIMDRVVTPSDSSRVDICSTWNI